MRSTVIPVEHSGASVRAETLTERRVAEKPLDRSCEFGGPPRPDEEAGIAVRARRPFRAPRRSATRTTGVAVAIACATTSGPASARRDREDEDITRAEVSCDELWGDASGEDHAISYPKPRRQRLQVALPRSVAGQDQANVVGREPGERFDRDVRPFAPVEAADAERDRHSGLERELAARFGPVTRREQAGIDSAAHDMNVARTQEMGPTSTDGSAPVMAPMPRSRERRASCRRGSGGSTGGRSTEPPWPPPRADRDEIPDRTEAATIDR